MLVVCTKDKTIIDAANDVKKGTTAWYPVKIIHHGETQRGANGNLETYLGQLSVREPLCLSAHGNDKEIGDEEVSGWSWTVEDIASYLATKAPPNYTGPILIHACAKQVSNFSTRLVNKLQQAHKLKGVWIFGYQKAVPSDGSFPDPTKLGDNKIDLYGAQVSF